MVFLRNLATALLLVLGMVVSAEAQAPAVQQTGNVPAAQQQAPVVQPAVSAMSGQAQTNQTQPSQPTASTPATVPPPPAAANNPSSKDISTPPIAPPLWLTKLIILAIVVSTLLALLIVRRGLLSSPGWSLGDALSEEADLTTDAGVAIKVMKASSSRLIAFVGLVVMLFLYLGFGVFTLYFFGTGQKLPPDLNDIENFMLAGLAMFAPYAVNQFRAAMEGLGTPAPVTNTVPATPKTAGNSAPANGGGAAKPNTNTTGGC